MLGAAPIGRRYSTCKLHISSVQDELEDTEIKLKNTQVLAVYIQHTLSLGEAFLWHQLFQLSSTLFIVFGHDNSGR